MKRSPRQHDSTVPPSHRRHVCCHECGYDLHAQPRHGRCPECNASVEIAREIHFDRESRRRTLTGDLIEFGWMTILCGVMLAIAVPFGQLHPAADFMILYFTPCAVAGIYFFSRLHTWRRRSTKFLVSTALLLTLLGLAQLWNWLNWT